MEMTMNDDRKRDVALFRLAVLGDLVHTELRRGALRRALEARAEQHWVFPDGKPRKLAAKTIQSWLYVYRDRGFDGLYPGERKDKGTCQGRQADVDRAAGALALRCMELTGSIRSRDGSGPRPGPGACP